MTLGNISSQRARPRQTWTQPSPNTTSMQSFEQDERLVGAQPGGGEGRHEYDTDRHEIHSGYSRTYKGRNNRQQIADDAKDLRAAADLDLATLRPHLLAAGASEADLDATIAKLHQLNRDAGRYP